MGRMTHTIRPFSFSDADYQSAINLRNRLYPDLPSTVEIWKHNDRSRRRDPSYHFFVAEAPSGKLLGFAQTAKLNVRSQKFSLGIICQSAGWQDGVADSLLDAVKQAAKSQNGNALVQKVQESDSDKLAFLTGRGFELIMRYPLSALDVSSFNAAPFRKKLAQTAASGITISQMPAGWQHDSVQQRFIHELDWQMMLDVPHHEERVKKSLEAFLADEVHHPNAFPESYFIAYDGSQAVGLTCFVKRGGKTNTVSTAITGVLRSHRRKGIATALKVHSIEFAKSIAECQTIITNNEENNPMYLLNQRLGFVARPAWLDLELKIA